MKSPPGVSANLKLPMREASSMPFSRSKDVSLLTAFFLLRLSVVLFEAKEFSPNGLAMRQKSRKNVFLRLCVLDTRKVLQVFAQKNVWMGRQPLLGILKP